MGREDLTRRTWSEAAYEYANANAGGVTDNLKIEINYMLRKCIVYDSAVALETPPEKFGLSNIGKVSRSIRWHCGDVKRMR